MSQGPKDNAAQRAYRMWDQNSSDQRPKREGKDRDRSLLGPDFLAYSYDKLGTLSPESSLLKNHCFYEGYAAEVPKSVVVLSACAGLRGLLQLENVSYVVEPLDYIPTYMHVLYQIRSDNMDQSSLPESSPVTPRTDRSYRIHVKQQVS
ncbi:Disintegrin and metalloproteinase domain-containing protein 18 [Fukomys damarensis]|uniref:Disintegrin and metalloproteinase domain-containing protein 18 n=1 Tax=Fukomys damarensis TaxID=885580 RepID=A0A091CUB2_FUKDA|nr:Disintegrin and metalloproteinase domain-containing protein 18 [Fukomys damarensis]